jgi:hypothetical protein
MLLTARYGFGSSVPVQVTAAGTHWDAAAAPSSCPLAATAPRRPQKGRQCPAEPHHLCVDLSRPHQPTDDRAVMRAAGRANQPRTARLSIARRVTVAGVGMARGGAPSPHRTTGCRNGGVHRLSASTSSGRSCDPQMESQRGAHFGEPRSWSLTLSRTELALRPGHVEPADVTSSPPDALRSRVARVLAPTVLQRRVRRRSTHRAEQTRRTIGLRVPLGRDHHRPVPRSCECQRSTSHVEPSQSR